MIWWKLYYQSLKQKRQSKPVTRYDSGPCDWLVSPLLLSTPTIQFSLDWMRRSLKRNRRKIEAFWFLFSIVFLYTRHGCVTSNGACAGHWKNCWNSAGSHWRRTPVNVTSGSRNGQGRWLLHQSVFSLSLIGILVSVSKNVLNAMFFRSCKAKVTSVSSKWLIQPWRLSVSVAWSK